MRPYREARKAVIVGTALTGDSCRHLKVAKLHMGNDLIHGLKGISGTIAVRIRAATCPGLSVVAAMRLKGMSLMVVS